LSVRGAQLDEFLTIAEVAERLKVDERTVRRWIKSGQLKAHKIGGCVRISKHCRKTIIEQGERW
jgi:excisionase family DNA binding protein